jgi:hypothetical protein
LQRVQDRITELALQSNPVGETSVRYQEEFGGESNLRYAETLKEQLDITIGELDGVIDRTGKRLTELLDTPLKSGRITQSAELRKLEGRLKAHRQTQLRLELGARGVTTADLDANAGRIRETESAIERQLTILTDAEYPEVATDYRPLLVEYYLQMSIVESLKAKRARLVSYIDAFKEKLDLVPQLEAELAKLDEQVKTDRELYNSFLRAKTSTQIGQAVQKTSLGLAVEVLEPASRPLRPERPKKKRIVLLALIIGATLGTGGLLLSEQMDTSFRDVADIERELELRVLGTVPAIDEGGAWKAPPTRRQAMIWAGTALVIIVIAVSGFYLYGRIVDRVVVSSAQSQYQGIDEIIDGGDADGQ